MFGTHQTSTGSIFELKKSRLGLWVPQNLGMLRERGQVELGVICGLSWLQLSKMLRAAQTPKCCYIPGFVCLEDGVIFGHFSFLVAFE